MSALRNCRTAGAALALPLVFLLVFLLASAIPAAAQVPAGPAEPLPGQHIVRPGDTFERLAATFLGDVRRWPEIAKLNPFVPDPKRLKPGSRLRIPIPAAGAVPAAQIERLSRQVAEKPSPSPWEEAHAGDLLVEEDGARTYGKSSVGLRFLDGTRLVITEDSLVFLRRSGNRLKGVSGKAIEILEGQADLAATGGPAPGSGRRPAAPGIEVVVGATKATSRPNPAGELKTRARKPGEGGAKVMVYGGEGVVESGGAKVALAEGMGSSVGKDGPPGAPEKLLPAPQLLTPPPGGEVAAANAVFTWSPIAEAAAYIVELCKDAGCGELLDRAILGTGTTWRREPLPVGVLYWRITARSRSGLDGYPAPAARVAVVASLPEKPKPTLAAAVAVSGRRIDVAGRLFTPAAGLSGEIVASEVGSSGCGVERTVQTIDGRPGVPAPLPAGDHVAVFYALDRCGNRHEAPPVAFTVDLEPPALHWEVTDPSIFEQQGEPKVARRDTRSRDERRDRDGLYWSSDGRRWLPLWRPVRTGRRGDADTPAVYANDEIASEKPQLFIRGHGVRFSIDGQEVDIPEGKLFWLTVDDGTGAGAQLLRFRTHPGEAGKAPVLELEAVDLVGNARNVAWPFAPGPGKP